MLSKAPSSLVVMSSGKRLLSSISASKRLLPTSSSSTSGRQPSPSSLPISRCALWRPLVSVWSPSPHSPMAYSVVSHALLKRRASADSTLGQIMYHTSDAPILPVYQLRPHLVQTGSLHYG